MATVLSLALVVDLFSSRRCYSSIPGKRQKRSRVFRWLWFSLTRFPGRSPTLDPIESDFKSGLIFAAATIPGAVAGALATTGMTRERFDVSFGLLLIAMATFLAINPGKKTAAGFAQAGSDTRKPLNLNGAALIAGAGVSTAFGFISSFFGIGGGFLYVPALVYLLRFPIHIATATSLFVLTITAFAGSATHLTGGLFQHGLRRVIALSIGAIIGAQIAARFSQRIRGDWIIRSLAAGMGVVGFSLVVGTF